MVKPSNTDNSHQLNIEQKKPDTTEYLLRDSVNKMFAERQKWISFRSQIRGSPGNGGRVGAHSDWEAAQGASGVLAMFSFWTRVKQECSLCDNALDCTLVSFVFSLRVLYCNEKFLFKIINEHSTVIGVFWWLCDEEGIGWELQGTGSRLYLPG